MDTTPPLNGKAKKIVQVMVCVPSEGHTLPEAYSNRIKFGIHLGVLQLASHLGIKEYDGAKYDYPEGTEFKFYWGCVGRVLTPLARERLTEFALAANVDYILMIDDDMIVPMDLFEKLYRHNVDIVAPLAFMRVPPHQPVMFKFDEGWDPQQRLDYFICNTVKNYPKNKLVRCDAVGFGAALLKTDYIKKMEPPYFMSTTKQGEDILHCHKAAKVGAKVYMDTSTQIGHLGIPKVIWEADYEREFGTQMRETHGDWTGTEKEARELTRAA